MIIEQHKIQIVFFYFVHRASFYRSLTLDCGLSKTGIVQWNCNHIQETIVEISECIHLVVNIICIHPYGALIILLFIIVIHFNRNEEIMH